MAHDEDYYDDEEESDVEDEADEAEEAADAGPQDDPEVVEALESYGARLDLNEEGWIWRVILYEKGGCDEALEYVKRLPEVSELWVIHTKVTPQAIEKLREEMPDLTIYR